MSNNSMKVCYVSPSFHFKNDSGRIGGGEISNRDLLINLSKDAYVVIISATGDGGWNKKHGDILSFEISALLEKYLFSRKMSVFLAKFFFRQIVLFNLNKIKPNIVFGCTYAASIINKYISLNSTCRGGLFVRAFENFSWYQKKSHWTKQLGRKLIYGNTSEKTVRKLSFIIVNSDFMKFKSEQFRLNDIIYTVYPAIEFSILNYKKLECINEIRMISTSKSKGFELFLELADAYPNLSFSVAGQKYLGDKKIPENVKIVGWLPDPQEFIKGADIFLVPSKVEETFGRVSVEATKLGVRVLVSDKGGLSETVLDRKEIILDSDNVEQWKNSIDKFINNPQYLDDLYMDIQDNSELYTLEKQYDILFKALEKECIF